MAEPEIDEAAAVRHFDWYATNPSPNAADMNAARAALAWKARAESSETESSTLLANWGIETDESLTECFLRNVWGWKERAEAAEAERDSLRRQLAQAVKAR